MFPYCLTFVQPVQSVDVVLTHLSGRSKWNIWIRDGLHGGLVVGRESIPGINRAWVSYFYFFVNGKEEVKLSL